MNVSDYGFYFYLDIVDGATPHSGFGLGVDRLIAKILELDVVTDAVPFPRTYNRLIP